MNQVPVMMQNPAYLEEVDEADPADYSSCQWRHSHGHCPNLGGRERSWGSRRGWWWGWWHAGFPGEEEKLDTEVKELRKEIMNLLSSIPEDFSSLQSAVVPQVEVWDTGKTWEQEYRLHPDPSIDEISNRLFNQVWDLLQILQERVDQRSCMPNLVN